MAKIFRRSFLGLLAGSGVAAIPLIFGAVPAPPANASATTTTNVIDVPGPFVSGGALDLTGENLPGLGVFKWLEVTGYDDIRSKVHVGFVFDTPVPGTDDLILTVTALDVGGVVLGVESTLCSDGRIATERVEMFGHMIASTGRNTPVIQLAGVDFDEIETIRLEFAVAAGGGGFPQP